jgi:hypothetical protein
MLRRIVMMGLAMGVMTGTLSAEQKAPAPKPTAQQPAGREAVETKAQPAPPPAEVKRRNVSIEVAITDQTGSGEPVKKVVSMIVADRQTGSVRSAGNAMPQSTVTPVPIERETLNVDVTPTIHQDDSVLLSLTLQYIPPPTEGDKMQGRAQLNERMGVTLESGKTLMISRAADPGSSRKITVELTATVMK